MSVRLLSGTVQGLQHIRSGLNNQDSWNCAAYRINNTSYRFGVVSDGCTGLPRFSRSEVGAHLSTAFVYAETQRLLAKGCSPEQVPSLLFEALATYLRNIAAQTMPPSTFWPYPVHFKQETLAFRNELKAPERFTYDHLAATVTGFIDDGTQLVIFQSGDGVIGVNGEVTITDQNDQPSYPCLGLRSQSFEVWTYQAAEIDSLLIATDGLAKVIAEPNSTVYAELLASPPVVGHRPVLLKLQKRSPEKMSDDCTVISMQRLEDEGEES